MFININIPPLKNPLTRAGFFTPIDGPAEAIGALFAPLITPVYNALSMVGSVFNAIINIIAAAFTTSAFLITCLAFPVVAPITGLKKYGDILKSEITTSFSLIEGALKHVFDAVKSAVGVLLSPLTETIALMTRTLATCSASACPAY